MTKRSPQLWAHRITEMVDLFNAGMKQRPTGRDGEPAGAPASHPAVGLGRSGRVAVQDLRGRLTQPGQMCNTRAGDDPAGDEGTDRACTQVKS